MPKKRKLISLQWQNLTSTISTTFVLILLGLVILCGLTAHRLSVSVRQSLTITVILSDEANDTTAQALKKKLEARVWVKDIQYISREQALKEQTEALGNDPSEFLGCNPFTPSYEMHLQAAYACTDSLLWVSKELRSHKLVSDVMYQKDLIERLNQNLLKITYFLLGLAVLLLIVTLVLINNTVRLSVFSRRFLIHTMRLVGAKWSFIRRPFMRRALWIGLCSGLLACAVLYGSVHAMWAYDATTKAYVTLPYVLITLGIVVVCGLLLTIVCTLVSVNHFLGMKESELYQ
ncbi:MAG: cell division protein FtsX [Bacteroidaceae bacterium]|nr:cell division protein FtsX [Bacteroidaceae bacterium]